MLHGSSEWWIKNNLMVQMSRSGLRVDFEGCKQLAVVIQKQGHRSPEAVKLAKELGLDPKWLPRQRR
jgi:hypothetical protein